jgi:hypothetical protein
VVYTYWRYEQLVWREAAARGDARLRAMTALARAAGVALVVAVATLVARVYVAAPGWWWGATWAALGGAAAALAGYAWARRGAARALRS